jgi:hypothetical protein
VKISDVLFLSSESVPGGYGAWVCLSDAIKLCFAKLVNVSIFYPIYPHHFTPVWAILSQTLYSHACFATCSPTPELQFEGIALMLKQSLFERLLSGKLLGLTVQRAAIKALSQIF